MPQLTLEYTDNLDFCCLSSYFFNFEHAFLLLLSENFFQFRNSTFIQCAFG